MRYYILTLMSQNDSMQKINPTSTIPEDFANFRIDKYLAKRFNYLSRSQWQNEIISGKIFLNSKRLNNYHKKIKTGDVVSYDSGNIDEPEVDKNYEILYEDDNLIGINKSGNLPTHPAGRFLHNTLLMILQNDLNLKLYPAHRLDRETSGVIIMAKDSKTASELQQNFGNVNKRYLAIVHGTVKDEEFTVDVPIGCDKNSKVRKKRASYPEAEEKANTSFKKIYSFSNYTLVKAFPETGRLHQIRVHLNYAGYPILGDKIYGLDDNFYLDFIENGYTEELLEKLKFKRCALHSESISFYHPVIKRKMSISAPIPGAFIDFIKSEDVDFSMEKLDMAGGKAVR